MSKVAHPTNQQSPSFGERLLAGDVSVLQEIEIEWRPRLERTLLRAETYLQPHDLDEVFSLALQRMWRSQKTFDPERATLFTWFRTIVIRLAYDRLRTNRRRILREGTCMDPALMNEHLLVSPRTNKTERVANFEHPENDVRRRHRFVLRQAIRRLSRRLQQVIRYDLKSNYDSANDREIARKLGVSVATVRRYRREAHARLPELCRKIEAERERERERERATRMTKKTGIKSNIAMI